MKITCNKEELLQAVRCVQNAITVSSLPILSHILILARENKLELTATNLESTICSYIKAQIDEEGSICLPGTKLYSILRELPTGQVHLETRNSQGLIQMEQIFFSLLAFPGEEFPETPVPLKPSFSLPQDTLKTILEKTMFSAGQDEVRQNLNCVLLEVSPPMGEGKEPLLKAVATDGRRLSLISLPNPSINEFFKVLIPLKSVRQLTKILEKEGEVEIGVEENRVFFNTPRFSFFSQLIDAKFPDYEKVFPKEYRITFEVGKEDIIGALRRISLLTEEQTRLIRFNLKENILSIKATSAGLGSAWEKIPVQIQQKEEIEIGFNAIYLLDALRVMEGEKLEIHLIDQESPGVFHSKTSRNYVYILMPVKLKE